MGENISEINVTIADVQKNKAFTELKENEKRDILKILNSKLDESQGAFRICKNCSYFEKITSRTLIMSKTIQTSVEKSDDLDRYKYMVHADYLPHTKDYICKNKDCATHKKPEIKDAVWFRPIAKTFNTYYACCVCEQVWKII